MEYGTSVGVTMSSDHCVPESPSSQQNTHLNGLWKEKNPKLEAVAEMCVHATTGKFQLKLP